MNSKWSSKLPNVGTTIFTVMSALAKEHNAINLSQGFPDFDCDPTLKELVCQAMVDGRNQYAPMRGVDVLLEAIANKIERVYHRSLDPFEEITITSGAAEAIFTAITTMVNHGDQVIVVDPAYDLYKPAIELNGGQAIPYALRSPSFSIDWEELEALITTRTRMIMINTPHNPIGKILASDDLLALEKIVEKHDLYVISDEVYEHLVYDNLHHESVISYSDLFKRCFAVFSFGKTFHVTGWRVGYCVAPPPLTKEFRKVHQFNVFTVTTPIQYGIAKFLKNPAHYEGLNQFFQEKRDYLQNALTDSRLRPHPSQGSYFQLYDYSSISDADDVQFVRQMTIEHGVAAIPISVFYSDPDPTDRLIRLCFGKTEETLARAAQRLCQM